MPAPRRLARIAGLLYLIVGICGGFAEIVRATVYKAGDAATTAANVATHAGLVRASVVADLVVVPTGLFTAMALYLLLKHVHANAARTMVVFLAVAAAMMLLNLAHQLQALHVSDAAYTGAFGGQGSDALVLLMVGCFGYLVDTFARFTTPDLGAALSPYVVTPAAVAEVSMVLWLLIKGVKVPQPDRPAVAGHNG